MFQCRAKDVSLIDVISIYLTNFENTEKLIWKKKARWGGEPFKL